MTKDEALRLALMALKTIDDAIPFPVAKFAQSAIKQVLEQPEPPCPYVVSTREGTHHCSLSQREPLTDVQIATVYWGATGQSLRPQDNVLAHKFARAIEAAHGIGEKK
jgi:hypothetical protein